jgi:hypothetical protein
MFGKLKMNNKEISMLSLQEWQIWYKNNQHKIWKKDNFDFNSRTESLRDVSKIMDETGLKAYFANGILLGAHRDNDYIPWDDDIDFDVIHNDFYQYCDTLKEIFIDMGYVVFLNKDHGMAKLNIYKNLEKISFDVLFDLDEHHYFRYRYKWPKKLYEKTEVIKFKGIEFVCPSPIEKYLVYVYGNDWMKPKKNSNKEMTLSKEIFLK